MSSWWERRVQSEGAAPFRRSVAQSNARRVVANEALKNVGGGWKTIIPPPVGPPVFISQQDLEDERAQARLRAQQSQGSNLFGPELTAPSPPLTRDYLTGEAMQTARLARDWFTPYQEFVAAGEAAQERRPLATLGWGTLGIAGMIPIVGDGLQAAGRVGRAVGNASDALRGVTRSEAWDIPEGVDNLTRSTLEFYRETGFAQDEAFAAVNRVRESAGLGPVAPDVVASGGRVRDISGDISRNVINSPNPVYTLPADRLASVPKGREVTAEVFYRQGFDLPPTAVASDEFSRAAQSGDYIVLYRGIRGGKNPVRGSVGMADEVVDARRAAEDFIRGDMFYGGGAGPDGSYFASTQDVARDYAVGGNPLMSSDEPGAVISALLPKDSRIVRYDDPVLVSEFAQSGYNNIGAFAAAKGYDAIVTKEGIHIVLNRSALTVADSPTMYRFGSDTPLPDGSVSADAARATPFSEVPPVNRYGVRVDENWIPKPLNTVEDLEASARTLQHGTLRHFQQFDSSKATWRGMPNARATSSRGYFYFTDQPEVAAQFAGQYSDIVPSQWMGKNGLYLDDIDESTLAVFRSDVERSLRGRRLQRVNDDGNFVDISPSDITFDDLVSETAFRAVDPNANIIETRVFGNELNLTGRLDPRTMPDGLREALEADGLLQPYASGFRLANWRTHEAGSPNTIGWMRENGFGRAVVPDAFESGGQSVIALEEFIEYGQGLEGVAGRLGFDAEGAGALADAGRVTELASDAANRQVVVGRDISEEFIKEKSRGEFVPQKPNLNSIPYERRDVAELAYRQGFEAPPTVVDSATFDAMERRIAQASRTRLPYEHANSGKETVIYRGLRQGPDVNDTFGRIMTPEYYADQLINGEYYVGHGVRGHGIYFAEQAKEALGYTAAIATPMGDVPGVLVRARISPDARLMDGLNKSAIADFQASLFSDISEYAIANGYDGIRYSFFSDPGSDHIVVLNRSALTFDETPRMVSVDDAYDIYTDRKFPSEILDRLFGEGKW